MEPASSMQPTLGALGFLEQKTLTGALQFCDRPIGESQSLYLALRVDQPQAVAIFLCLLTKLDHVLVQDVPENLISGRCAIRDLVPRIDLQAPYLDSQGGQGLAQGFQLTI